MRRQLPEKFEAGRLLYGPTGSPHNAGPWGAFVLYGPCGARLKIIASDASIPEAQGFEHVSVSTENRCPNWQEMCFVKDAFWEDEEIVYQLHPAKSEWVNNHPHVLHLWRNIAQNPPLPPSIFVGIKEDGTYANKAEAKAGYQRAKARGLIK